MWNWFHIRYFHPMHLQARTIAIAIIALTGAAIVALAGWRLLMPHSVHIDLDRSEYPVIGIDISSHNGRVDFRRARLEGGVRFVYLKATEGADFRDKAFAANFDSARAAGLDVGPYHFFRFDTEGAEQARNIISTLNGRIIDLPVAIDVEESGNPAQVPTETIMERLQALRATLAAAGIPSLIYTNKAGYSRFMRRRISDADLWICSFTTPPISSAVSWRLWQHSHRATIPGIKGPVDLNTFNGDTLAYRTWLKAQ
ncbi:MAG: hypothetical protein K2M06_06040 [Muribaculaceae bacterium]|nr:hypothetical protein [Muribaculaceae bacterium]